MFIISLDYVLGTSIDQIKEMFHTKIIRSRRYHAETMTDADYADDRVFSQIYMVSASM